MDHEDAKTVSVVVLSIAIFGLAILFSISSDNMRKRVYEPIEQCEKELLRTENCDVIAVPEKHIDSVQEFLENLETNDNT